jgi:hypothetical protein
MSIKQLLKDNPRRFITRAKVWTPDRRTIETEFSHGDLVGKLLVNLLVRDGPLNADEEVAMNRLLKMFDKTRKKRSPPK